MWGTVGHWSLSKPYIPLFSQTPRHRNPTVAGPANVTVTALENVASDVERCAGRLLRCRSRIDEGAVAPTYGWRRSSGAAFELTEPAWGLGLTRLRASSVLSRTRRRS